MQRKRVPIKNVNLIDKDTLSLLLVLFFELVVRNILANYGVVLPSSFSIATIVIHIAPTHSLFNTFIIMP